MTPRRPVRHALSLVVGGIAAMALVGCGNGMQVAGPEKPHESVLSGRATPSAKASAKPANTPSPDPSTTQSGGADAPGSGDNGADGSGADDSGADDSGQGSGRSGDNANGSGSGGSGRSGKDKSDSGRKGSDNTDSGSGNDSGGRSAGSGNSDDKSGGQPKSDPQATQAPKKAKATCTLDDLSVAVRVPEGSGAAGSTYVLITFTNISGTSCWMYGYAGVSFVGNKNGTQLGKPAVRDESANAEQVKLADGKVQTELLRISSAGNYDAADCVPTTSDGFRIYPPGSFTSAYVEFATDACQSKSVRQLTVYPVGTKS